MIKKIILFIIFAMVLLLQYSFAQPFYYYSLQPHEKENQTDSYSIYRFNLTSGVKELFLTDNKFIYALGWDPSQTWVYYWNDCEPDVGPIHLINSEFPNIRKTLPYEGEVNVYGFFYLPKSKKIFLTTWSKNMVYNSETLAPIDSFAFQNYMFSRIHEIPSDDELFTYSSIRDTTDELNYLQKFSLSSYSVVGRKREYEIGHPVEEKWFCGGKNGIALYGYGYLDKGYYTLYSTKTASVVFTLEDNLITNPYLSSDAKYLIIEETPVNPDRSPKAPMHLRPGKISVYEVETGNFKQKLNLPPDGKVLVFDNYPNMLYYYLENQQRSINIDLSKLSTITSITPSTVTAGNNNFTLTVNGKNFLNNSTVYINNNARTTTYVSDTVLQANILSSDVEVTDTLLVTVKNILGDSTSTESNPIKLYVIPRQENVDALIDSLRIRLQQSNTNKWIGNQQWVNELDKHLQNAKKQYAKGEKQSPIEQLEVFCKQIKNEYESKNKNRWITKEGFEYLYPYAQNIIERMK